MRTPLKITSRSSTITNAFVQAILPFTSPLPDERAEVLTHFGQSDADMRCVYCGDSATDWDHLVPLVTGKRPSGFTSGRGNMVPACGRCNQSKSGHPWKNWMRGKARNSPAGRGVKDVEQRVEMLEQFIARFPHNRFDYAVVVPRGKWDAYWAKHEEIQAALREAQVLADEIKSAFPPPLQRPKRA